MPNDAEAAAAEAAKAAADAGGEGGGDNKVVPIERFNRVYGRSKELESSLGERDKAIQSLSQELEEHRNRISVLTSGGGKKDDDEPVTREEVSQITAQAKREIRAEQAQAFLLAQPEAKEDKEFKGNIKGIVKEYGLNSLDPINAAELAMTLYRAATKSGGKEDDDDGGNGNGNGGRSVDKAAVRSLRGGGKNGSPSFTAQDIGNMSIEDYKKNRDKILSAAKRGEIE
jgi:hypothetical protein